MKLTFNLARDAPVGVVIARYTSKLSRMFLWDTHKDKFEAGQFLKAEAFIEDVSPDGRYVAYFAHSHCGRSESYVAIARPPFFTALAFFPTFHLSGWHARFPDNKTLDLSVSGLGALTERIDPGCPLQILRTQPRKVELAISGEDFRHRRKLLVKGDCIEATDSKTAETCVVKCFERAPFEAIPPPGWATRW